MLPDPTLYGSLLVALVLPAAGLGWVVWGKRDKPGARWLLVTVVGMAGWSVCWGLMLLLDGRSASLASLNLVLLFVNLVAIGWVMMTLEFSQQTRYRLRYVSVLFVLPAITQLIAWTNPSHGLLWGPGTALDAAGVVQADRGPWFLVHSGYNLLLMLVSGTLLVNDYVTFDGIYRKQTGVMIGAWSIPLVTSLAYSFGSLPLEYVNPSPLGFLIGGAVWAWGLYRFRLFEIVPVARRTAFDQMDEAVVSVDESGTVVDANPAAVAMFSLDESPTGTPVEEALDAVPTVVSFLRDDGSREAAVTVSVDGERRHLTATKTRINDHARDPARVAVFKDVTRLKNHERDLELLKQVFARVFRHDMSNDLNVVRAYAELLAAQNDGDDAAYAQNIVNKCDKIIDTSNKAQAIEKLVDADRKRYDVDLVRTVADVAAWAADRYPDAAVETDLPEEAWVRADGDIDMAVRCLVENALDHNPVARPWVRLRVENAAGTVRLTVEDDGPGIGEFDRKVFEERHVDQLSHSSGLGLWTIDWVVRNSDGDVAVETSDRGTRIDVTLPRVAETTTRLGEASR